ncbi:MAG: hypothetical protein MK101_02305 [Phycisphaerales bacterium]|nr:hypothetical protein [Phycisphaerales bacterium]
MLIHGHKDAIDTLSRAIASGRMPHAWVFAGPPGVGKCTLAMEAARILLDADVPPSELGTQTGSPTSKAGIAIEAGTHPDLHVIRRELAAYSNNAQLRDRKQMSIPIDLLREHIIGGRTSDGAVHEAPAWHRPVLGHAKVFIIDEAQYLDKAGQNALLKTLEEPPPATTFFLVTDRPERLLPTIHSRCQVLHLSPVGDEDMQHWFVSQGVRDGDRPWLASWSEGAPGMAARAIDWDLREWDELLGSIVDRLDRGIWTADAAESIQSTLESWTDARVSENPRASKEATGREGVDLLIRMLTRRVQVSMRQCADQGDHAGAARSANLIDLLAQTERRVGSNLNRKHVLDSLVASWAAMS